MNKLALYLILPAIIMLGATCQNKKAKPKPTSTDGKTAVTVNGKKDSVLNNPDKNYGNATVAEPCVKCVIKVIQTTDHYKKVVSGKQADKISYVVNWDSSAKAKDSLDTKSAIINSLKIEIFENSGSKNKLATFNYDNRLSKLFFVSDDVTIDEKISETDANMIRRKCFWNVASSK